MSSQENVESKPTLLIVDDSEINRGVLTEIFKDKYTILEAENGKQAMALIVKSRMFLAGILLDINMPEMDGFEVLTEINKVNLLERMPVIMITGETSKETEHLCYEKGVTDVVYKPFDSIVVRQKVNHAVELFDVRNHLQTRVDEQTKVLRKQYDQIKEQRDYMKETNTRIIDTVCTIVEFRNLESGYHLKRIRESVKILGKYVMGMFPEMGLTAHRLEIIAGASAMHDLGKICIPDSILLKPGKLTKDEFEVMKSHTTRGCEILKMLADVQDKEYYEASYDICRHHHEKYDGNGYPDGLKGDEISLAAQLTSIADVYDALISDRVYKAAYSMDKAYSMIVNGECGAFNPKLMEAFKAARGEIGAMFLMTKLEEKKENDA
ncbi:response regulator [Butyrivibrio sp. MC2013]|uniref:response regulator n=1 Tax=Butyrivibrio sp. MC2013 TaxID=1280686 RepID=UPI00040F046D|nr:HD domain-containing phosphohydrolase [Butyrivibrio sp. MC2013]